MEQGSNHQTYMAFAHKWRIHMDIMGYKTPASGQINLAHQHFI
jgi:hypothetical protein